VKVQPSPTWRLPSRRSRARDGSRQRIYRQDYVVFLGAAVGKIGFLREYFDPTRAAKAMNASFLDLEA
jgi:ketosteroid isomerase-like protein